MKFLVRGHESELCMPFGAGFRRNSIYHSLITRLELLYTLSPLCIEPTCDRIQQSKLISFREGVGTEHSQLVEIGVWAIFLNLGEDDFGIIVLERQLRLRVNGFLRKIRFSLHSGKTSSII